MTRTYVVPGRVELVGKHVDYGGGRSLTCAIHLALRARATPIDEPVLRVRQRGASDTVEVAVSPTATPTPASWSGYVAAVARRVSRDFPSARRGVEVDLTTELPTSAGLSSSAALTIALAWALVDANELTSDARYREGIPSMIAFAEYCAAIETGSAFGAFAGDAGVGVRAGAQDPVAILCARAGDVGCFGYLPAREEGYTAWPADHAIAVAVSGVKASKSGNVRDAYNRLSDEMRARSNPEREAQFAEECDVIVPGVAEALARRDFARVGALVERSQGNAERVLRNQVPETISLVATARDQGAVAASAFGAGFGGAVWAMVPVESAARFVDDWEHRYVADYPARAKGARFFVTTPSAPARRDDA